MPLPADAVILETINRNGGERSCRTEIFARTASDATGGVDDRRPVSKFYRICGAMPFTGGADHTVLCGDTPILVPHGTANLHVKPLFSQNGDNRPCRTRFRTACTPWTAIAMLKTHLRQKEPAGTV